MIRLAAHPHTLHFRKPAATSRGALTERRLWRIEAIDTESGVTGVGEVGVTPALSIDDHPDLGERIRTFVDQFNSAHVARSDDILAPFAPMLAPLPAVRFGVEVALLDMLHGGNGILFPGAFTRGQAELPTHGLIWVDTPDAMLDQVRARIAAGFGVIKMKVGALPWREEIALLRSLRRDFPDVELRLDANCAYPLEGIDARLEALAEFDVVYLEEPALFDSLDEYAALIARSPIPLCLDETLLGAVANSTLPALLQRLRPPHVVLKPSLLGGFAPTHALIDECERLGIAWWLNSLLESAVGHSAICQFAAATGDKRVHGLGTGGLFADNFPSPIALRGNRLCWVGAEKSA